jgi:hypothetical protein
LANKSERPQNQINEIRYQQRISVAAAPESATSLIAERQMYLLLVSAAFEEDQNDK